MPAASRIPYADKYAIDWVFGTWCAWCFVKRPQSQELLREVDALSAKYLTRPGLSASGEPEVTVTVVNPSLNFKVWFCTPKTLNPKPHNLRYFGPELKTHRQQGVVTELPPTHLQLTSSLMDARTYVRALLGGFWLCHAFLRFGLAWLCFALPCLDCG